MSSQIAANVKQQQIYIVDFMVNRLISGLVVANVQDNVDTIKYLLDYLGQIAANAVLYVQMD